MKTALRILLAVIPLFAFQIADFGTSQSESITYAEQNLDSIRVADLSLNGFKIGTVERDVYAKAGKPDSISTLIDECGDGTKYKKLHYGRDLLYIKKGKLYDFNITTNRFKIDYQQIKVGDPRDKIRKLFPNSYIERFEKGAVKQTIDIRIGTYDAYLKIFVDRDKVTGFMTWEPC